MKLTINQQRVLMTLRQSDSPLSAYVLLDKLREHGLTAPTQVYRALKRLETYGLVHRLESINAYVACSPSRACHKGMKAFAICDECGHVDELIDEALCRSVERWTKAHAFVLRSSTIELRGKCANCVEVGIRLPQRVS